MKPWHKYRLGDIVEIKGGKRLPKGHDYATQVTAYPYLRVVDFKNKSIDMAHLKYLEENTAEAISRYTIHKEDVYISIAGTVGLVGTIPECLDGAHLTENAAKLVIKDPDLIDKEYLVTYLSSDEGKRQIEKQTITTSQPKLSLFRMEELVIPIPDKTSQRKIVEVLKKAQALIDKRCEQVDTCHTLIQSKFIELFGSPITNPMGWEVKALNEICDVRDGTHDSPTYVPAGYPLVTSKNIVDGALDLSHVNYITKEDYDKINQRSKVDLGDIIMPMIGTIGNPLIIIEEPHFAIKNVALIKFNKTDIDNIYVHAVLSSELMEQVKAEKSRGGTQKFLSLGDIRKLNIPIPPLALQNEFAKFVKQVHELQVVMIHSLQALKDNHHALMQKAFKGELY